MPRIEEGESMSRVKLGKKRTEPAGAGDLVVPEQFFDRAKLPNDPERRLRLAVLEEALSLFQKHIGATEGRPKFAFQEVLTWISSRDRSWPFAFENVCDALEIDPDYLRDGLARRRRSMLHSVPPRSTSAS
jgi:hypothetical protein